MQGLASDGGLYVPEEFPSVTEVEIADMGKGMPYEECARRIMRLFVDPKSEGDILEQAVSESYREWRHEEVCPLREYAPNRWMLELFHGPTLAFKDFALQPTARMMSAFLERRGERATVIVATSGDTGAATAHAFAGRPNANAVIFHPKGRVSDVQRKQMTATGAPNVRNVAVEGSFDECQLLMKEFFIDERLRRRFALAGTNSINWSRIMAQTVYYFVAAAALGAPERDVAFCVPTGNFGDVYAGYVARRMGLASIRNLGVAVNENDALVDAIERGTLPNPKSIPTTSPAMDISMPSNFERLVFGALDGQGERVNKLFDNYSFGNALEIPAEAWRLIREVFSARSARMERVAETQKRMFGERGILIDPHTAVGVAAAEDLPAEIPTVVLSTADPCKFPDSVKAACGVEPPIPDVLAALLDRPEECESWDLEDLVEWDDRVDALLTFDDVAAEAVA